MSKRIALSVAKPRIEAPVEEWIKDRNGHEDGPPPEPTTRLTFDLRKSLHKRLKHAATEREQTIADVIRELLEREFPAP